MFWKSIECSACCDLFKGVIGLWTSEQGFIYLNTVDDLKEVEMEI
jgi:hypothetical protein